MTRFGTRDYTQQGGSSVPEATLEALGVDEIMKKKSDQEPVVEEVEEEPKSKTKTETKSKSKSKTKSKPKTKAKPEWWGNEFLTLCDSERTSNLEVRFSLILTFILKYDILAYIWFRQYSYPNFSKELINYPWVINNNPANACLLWTLKLLTKKHWN